MNQQYQQKYAEQLRIKSLKHLASDALLDAGLAGRPRTIDNVVKLWMLVAESLDLRCVAEQGLFSDCRGRFWNVISAYLAEQGWPRRKLEALRCAEPWRNGGVLEELGETPETLDKLLGATKS
jgi:hypothetical protein